MPSRPNKRSNFESSEEFLSEGDNFLLEDGYYVQKAEKVLPFGNKVSHSSQQFQLLESKNHQKYNNFSPEMFENRNENIDEENEYQNESEMENSPNSGYNSSSNNKFQNKSSKSSKDFGNNENYGQKAGFISKNNSNHSPNYSNKSQTDLNSLRKKNAFNWQKVSRNFAIFGIFLTILAILTTGTAFAWYTYQYNNAPNIAERFNNFEESSVIFANDGKTRIFELFGRKAGDGKRENVNIDRIPKVMQLATVAIEDRFFYYNEDGIPWQNIAGAMVDCVLSGFKNCRGGSGLSQQLVKNVTGEDKATPDRKIRELFTAIKMNREGGSGGKEISKDDVLTAYLNISFFSRNSLGVQQASRAYFGHDVDAKDDKGEYKLTPPKACYLAGLVQSPTTYSSSIEERDGEAWRIYERRKNDCLEIMAGKKYTNNKGEPFNIQGDGKEFFIKNDEELTKWKNDKVEFIENKIEDPYPHFRGYVQQEIVKFLDSAGLPESALYNKGLKIVTTLDPTIQKKTEEIVKNNGDKIRAVGGNNASAMVMDGPSGEILALVGSLDYNNEEIKGKVNIATTPQQPGSSIKPYVYASAFNKGFNPGTILIDAPTTFDGGFKPNNFARDFKGPMSIHYAFSNSRNIPAVKGLFLSSGVDKLDGRSALDNWFEFTENSGVKFPCQNGDKDEADASKNCSNTTETGKDALYRNRCFYGSAIGGCEVTMTSHITGINTLLQEGNLSTATPFKSITDKNGLELFGENRNKIYPKVDKKIEPTVARQTALVMADQDRKEFGQFQSLFTIKNWKLAGKTGTTDGNRDTWMVGGSPLFTTTVWAGRTDNGEMAANVQASNLALPMWNEIQQMLHTDRKPVAFSSEGLKQVSLDPQTGFLATGGTPEWLSEKQIKVLQEAGGRISMPEYDPRTKNIFQNRSSVIVKKFKFNKLDGKLAVDGKTLEENVEEKNCTEYLGEFPGAKGWSESLGGPKEQTLYVKKNLETGQDEELYRSGCNFAEKSDQDQVADKSKAPEIKNDNEVRNGATNVGEIKATFKSPVTSKKITKAYLKVNGKTVKSYEDPKGTDQITLAASGIDIAKDLDLISGDKTTISFETEDSSGATANETVNNVVFAAGKAGTPRTSNSANSQNTNSNNTQSSQSEKTSSPKPFGTIQTPSNLSIANGSSILTLNPAQNLPKAPTLIITQGSKTTSCQSFLVAGNYVCGVSLAGFSEGSAKVSVSEEDYSIPDFSITLKP